MVTRYDGTEVRLRLIFWVQLSCRVTDHPNLPRTEGVPRVWDLLKLENPRKTGRIWSPYLVSHDGSLLPSPGLADGGVLWPGTAKADVLGQVIKGCKLRRVNPE